MFASFLASLLLTFAPQPALASGSVVLAPPLTVARLSEEFNNTLKFSNRKDALVPREKTARRVRIHGAASSKATERARSASGSRVVYEPVTRSDNRFGIYVTANTMKDDERLDRFMDGVAKVNGSAIVVEVKGGYAFFTTTSELAAKYDLVRPMGDLTQVIDRAHRKGLYVIGRFIALNDPLLAQRAPETRVKHPKSGVGLGETWVDGSHPTVLEYNRQLLKDLVVTGIDEVNLDYIRFSTELPGILAGYSTEEKVAHIEEFVKMAREVINEYSPKTKLGLSTYAILGWNYDVNLNALGQDVVKFAPLVDVISPMAYPSTFSVDGGYYNPDKHKGSRDYYLVWRTLEGYKKLLGEEVGREKLRPWIQGYFITQKQVLDQVQAVYDAGLCGFTVWNANNNYETTLTALAAMPKVPEHCVGYYDYKIVKDGTTMHGAAE